MGEKSRETNLLGKGKEGKKGKMWQDRKKPQIVAGMVQYFNINSQINGTDGNL